MSTEFKCKGTCAYHQPCDWECTDDNGTELIRKALDEMPYEHREVINEWWDEQRRLARLGAAVEAMPPGLVLERESWIEHAWNCRSGRIESTLQATALEALEDMQRLLKLT